MKCGLGPNMRTNFHRKTFAEGGNITKFGKFSPAKVPSYTVYIIIVVQCLRYILTRHVQCVEQPSLP